MKKFIYPILWGVLIVILSGTPGKKMPTFNVFQEDKIGHFGVYAIFAILWLYSLLNVNFPFKKAAMIAFLIAAGLGMTMEWCQANLFVDRSFDYADEIANCIGAGIGIAFFHRFLLKRMA
jgi:VanZ family protein